MHSIFSLLNHVNNDDHEKYSVGDALERFFQTSYFFWELEFDFANVAFCFFFRIKYFFTRGKRSALLFQWGKAWFRLVRKTILLILRNEVKICYLCVYLPRLHPGMSNFALIQQISILFPLCNNIVFPRMLSFVFFEYWNLVINFFAMVFSSPLPISFTRRKYPSLKRKCYHCGIIL